MDTYRNATGGHHCCCSLGLLEQHYCHFTGHFTNFLYFHGPAGIARKVMQLVCAVQLSCFIIALSLHFIDTYDLRFMDSTTTNRSFSKLISARGLVPSSSSHHSSCEALPDLIYSSEDSSCSNTRTRRRPQSQSFEGALVDSGRSHPQVVSFVAGGKKVGGSHRRSSSVSFSTIEINYFDFDLGDNPSCSSTGPPLTICWKPNSSKTLDIDTFEEGRTGKRRSDKDLKIDAFSRHDILRKTGEQ